MAGLTRVGLGFRAHSGWAAMVVVGGSPASPAVLDRRRIEIADRKTDGSVQPYHRAKELGVEKGERFLERCADVSRELARLALREIGSAHNVTGCGILLSSGRPAASLQATLASHAAIHTA